MRFEQIGKLTDIVKTWNPLKAELAGTFHYIDIGSIDQQTKTISDVSVIAYADAPSRARQLVQAGDILVSTVRPNLNAVAVVPAVLDGATASTGFSVLRPTSELINQYLFHWVRSAEFIRDMTAQATGQSYPAISDKIIRKSRIPLPDSVGKQRAISTVLDQADELRSKRRRSISLLNDLAQSIFHEMFGNLIANERSWPEGSVSSLVKGFEAGKSLAEGEDDAASRFRILKISAVTSGRFIGRESKPAPAGYVPPTSHIVHGGDLLFSRANTSELIGATAFVPDGTENLLMPDKLWRFIWSDEAKPSPWFVYYLFKQPSMREVIRRNASGSSGSMKNVSQGKVLSIKLGIPSSELQCEFEQKVLVEEDARERAESQMNAFHELFASLQTKAFSGEL